MNTQRAPATCGPLPFPGCAGRSGRRLHPRCGVGRPSSCPLPSARPCDRAAPAPRLSSPPGAAGASSVSMLPGPTPGLSKVSGLNKDHVCSMKMHQIHVLKTTESWLMSAKGCGNNTRAVSASFKSQSGPSAQSQLRSLPGRLSVQPSGLRWCRRHGRHRPASPTSELQAPALCGAGCAVSDTLPLPRPRRSPSPLRLGECVWEDGDSLTEVGLGSDRA